MNDSEYFWFNQTSLTKITDEVPCAGGGVMFQLRGVLMFQLRGVF